MREIKEKCVKSPLLLQNFGNQDSTDHSKILDILIKLCGKPKINHYIKFRAIEWIQEYLKIFQTFVGQ